MALSDVYRRLWKVAPLRRSPSGEHGGNVPSPGTSIDSNVGCGNGASLYWISVRGARSEGFFTEVPEKYITEGRGNRHFSPYGANWGI